MEHLPKVLENIIYKKVTQLHYQDCLDEIKKIDYKIKKDDDIWNTYKWSKRTYKSNTIIYQKNWVGNKWIELYKNDEWIPQKIPNTFLKKK